MKKSLFPDGGVWLKGNIHSHSTVSDGMFSPRELAELYRDHGYAFLSMTDHNVLVSHSELPRKYLRFCESMPRLCCTHSICERQHRRKCHYHYQRYSVPNSLSSADSLLFSLRCVLYVSVFRRFHTSPSDSLGSRPSHPS